MVNLRKVFFPSAQEGAARRQRVFGTTSKTPAIVTAASVLPIGRIARAAGSIFRLGKPTVTAAVPVASRAATGFFAKARGIYDQALGNPLAAGGIKGFAGRIFGRSLGGASLATGAAFTKAALTGQEVDITPRRLTYGTIGFALGGPIGSLAGIGLAGGEKAAEELGNIANNLGNINIPPPVVIGGMAGEETREILQALQQLGSGYASGFSVGGTPSYGVSVSGPSVNVGGGPDLSGYLLALLGGLGGGLLLARRKRKKKKSKKSKRSKK